MSIDQPEDDGFDVHPDILKLGLVSFLTDFSSEMIFSVFAVFFTTIAGASGVFQDTCRVDFQQFHSTHKAA